MSFELDIGMGDNDVWGYEELGNINLEVDFFDTEIPADKSALYGETSSPLSSDNDVFDWESSQLSDDMIKNFLMKSEPLNDQPANIPLPVNSDDAESVTTDGGSTSNSLLRSYGMSDEELSDIALKKLKSLCKNDKDYEELKAYRRTCQNRYYARSSRNKQQVKTVSLTKKLDQSEKENAQLRKEITMKDTTIKYLQMELDLMRSRTQ